MSVSRDDILVSESPILSMVMTSNSSLDCGMLSSVNNDSASLNQRSRRDISDEDSLIIEETPSVVPNIDFLLNPDKKSKRNEYEEVIMERLRHFFRDRNSSMLYPNLFRKGFCRNNDHWSVLCFDILPQVWGLWDWEHCFNPALGCCGTRRFPVLICSTYQGTTPMSWRIVSGQANKFPVRICSRRFPQTWVFAAHSTLIHQWKKQPTPNW